MKLKNKLAAITAAAMVAFVGVGFAAWAFTNEVNDSATISGKVTAAIEAQGLSVQDGSGNELAGIYLICDAPEGEEGLLDGDGIYWSTQANGSDTITALTLVGSVNYDANDIADCSTYVGQFTAPAFEAVDGTYVDIAAVAAFSAEVTSEGPSASVSTTYTLPVPSYDLIPTNVAGVNALETEVHALSLSLSFTFKIKSIN